MRRYSDFFITVNTQQTFSRELYDLIAEQIYDVLPDNTALAAELLGVGEGEVLRATVHEVTIELARQRKKALHFHFNWEILHSTTVHIGPRLAEDGKGLNQRLQEYFTETLRLPQSCYVRADLRRDSSASKNYALKEQQNRASEALDIADRDLFRR